MSGTRICLLDGAKSDNACGGRYLDVPSFAPLADDADGDNGAAQSVHCEPHRPRAR